MGESKLQKEFREELRVAIKADQELRQKGRIVKADRISDAPGEDCPGCHGKAGRKACGTCGI